MGVYMGMTTSSDDDLDVVKAVKKDLGHEDYIESKIDMPILQCLLC